MSIRAVRNAPVRGQIVVLILLATLAAVPLAQFAGAVARTITADFDLEHCEGEVASSICDAREGRAIYPDSSSSRVGLIYGPIYYWLSAAWASCEGPALFVAPRVASLLSYLALLIVAPLALTRAGRGRRFECAFGILVFTFLTLTLFRRLGAWYFLARVDMPTMIFAFGAWATLRNFGRSTAALLTVGVLQALAAGCKQSVLIQTPFLALAALERPFVSRESWRRVTLTCAPVVLLFAGFAFGAGKPFLDYLFTIPGRHGPERAMILSFWTRDLFHAALVESLLAAGYLAFLVRRGAWDELRFTACFLVPLVVSGYAARVHTGNYVNCVIPAVFALIVTGLKPLGMGLRRALDRGRGEVRGVVGLALALTVVLAVGFGRRWGLTSFDVDPSSARATAALVDLARRFTIFFTELPQINRMAGRYDASWPAQLNFLEWYRVDWTRVPPVDPTARPAPVARVEDLVGAGHFDFVIAQRLGPVTDQNRLPNFVMVSADVLCAKYVLAGYVRWPSPATLTPVTGGELRPELALVRRTDRARLTEAFTAHYGLDAPAPVDADERVPRACRL